MSRRTAVLVSVVAALVVPSVFVGAAIACNDPTLRLSPGAAGPGDPVSIVITNVEPGAKWDVVIEGRTVAEGVVPDGATEVTGESFEMPDLGSENHAVQGMATVVHDGGAVVDDSGHTQTLKGCGQGCKAPDALNYRAAAASPGPPQLSPPAPADVTPVPAPPVSQAPEPTSSPEEPAPATPRQPSTPAPTAGPPAVAPTEGVPQRPNPSGTPFARRVPGERPTTGDLSAGRPATAPVQVTSPAPAYAAAPAPSIPVDTTHSAPASTSAPETAGGTSPTGNAVPDRAAKRPLGAGSVIPDRVTDGPVAARGAAPARERTDGSPSQLFLGLAAIALVGLAGGAWKLGRAARRPPDADRGMFAPGSAMPLDPDAAERLRMAAMEAELQQLIVATRSTAAPTGPTEGAPDGQPSSDAEAAPRALTTV